MVGYEEGGREGEGGRGRERRRRTEKTTMYIERKENN